MRGPKKSRKAASRKDLFAVIGIFVYLCSLIFRILLQFIIGEKGIGYFSIASEIYFLSGCVLATGLSEAVTVLVRFRIRREQFKNADRVLRGALLLGLITGGVLALSLFSGGWAFAKNTVRMPLAGLSLSFIAPAVIFQMLTGAFRGYFQGNGTRIPTTHSRMLEMLFLMIGGLIGAKTLYGYGQKVAALRQNADYAAAYGAMGAGIGILTASVLAFFHMLLLFAMYHRNAKRQLLRDIQKTQDGVGHILYLLLRGWVPYGLYQALYYGIVLLDACFFMRMAKAADAVDLWGRYYGRYMVFVGLAGGLLSFAWLEPVRKITALMEHEEYRPARDRMEIVIHQTAMLSIPVAVFLAVFSENLLNLIFKGNNADSVSYLIWGGAAVALHVFPGLFSYVLLRLRRMKYVIVCEAAALLVHIALLLVLLGNTKLSVTAVIIGNLVFLGILAAAEFAILSRLIQYRPKRMKEMAFLIVDAGIAGLVAMLLNKGIASFAGTTISLVISLPLGIILYAVLMIVTRAVSRQELEDTMAGGILIRLGSWMHFM